MEGDLAYVVKEEKESCDQNGKPNLSQGNSDFIQNKIYQEKHWRYDYAPNDNFLTELVDDFEWRVVIQLLIILDPDVNKQILQHGLVNIFFVYYVSAEPTHKMCKIDKHTNATGC